MLTAGANAESIQIEKTVEVLRDPVSAAVGGTGTYAIPGAVLRYSITMTAVDDGIDDTTLLSPIDPDSARINDFADNLPDDLVIEQDITDAAGNAEDGNPALNSFLKVTIVSPKNRCVAVDPTIALQPWMTNGAPCSATDTCVNGCVRYFSCAVTVGTDCTSLTAVTLSDPATAGSSIELAFAEETDPPLAVQPVPVLVPPSLTAVTDGLTQGELQEGESVTLEFNAVLR